MPWLGVDIGGTFTDLVLYDEDSKTLRLEKTPSTPDDHSRGMLAGIDALGLDLDRVGKLAHGTTVATNTVLERNGARTAVLITQGFRDVLEVGRGNRTVMYDFKATRPKPLIPRSRVFEVDERCLFDGTVRRGVSPSTIESIAEKLRAMDVEAVAVCYLHAYANDSNERLSKQTLQKILPDAFVSTSSEVLPELREFERFATTALNVYVGPRMRRYLDALGEALALRGYRRPLAIMMSNGGTWPVSKIIKFPVNSMFSGPAAGVIGAVNAASEAGYGNVITYDMGGTSTDTCLIKDFRYAMSNEGKIGTMPNRVQQIEINSIGSGGGSIVSLGPAKFLQVGPESAGALPGPVCYGRGGTAPTVTDANLVLGRLGKARVLGGEIRLDVGSARRAVGRLADRLGLDAVQMAQGIIDLAVSQMTGSIKEISIMRGHDPRDFALFAYGGAGPMHAAFVAAELGMLRVVIPPMPGNFSAFGLLTADVRHELVRTQRVPTAIIEFADVTAVFEEMCEAACRDLTRQGFAKSAIRFERRLDMRYIGQAFELSVPVSETAASMADVDKAFHEAYETRYAHVLADPTEIVCFRVSACGLVAKPAPPKIAHAGSTLDDAMLGNSDVYFGSDFVKTALYDRSRLPPTATFEGPAIVEESGATTIVPPGFVARTDPNENLLLEQL